MGIISYAQNYEDVILWRALGGLEDGFYLDVGANDPEELSVTKWFYDQGWHGINLEPSEEYYQLLCKAREPLCDQCPLVEVCPSAGL